MTAVEVFQALGGGLTGLLGLAVVALAWKISRMYEDRDREKTAMIATRDEQLKNLTAAVNRVADVAEAQAGKRARPS